MFMRAGLHRELIHCGLQIPSNIILKKLRPSIWLPTICLAWGMYVQLDVYRNMAKLGMLTLDSVTMCTGFVKNFESLVVVRLLLGFMEAGLFVSINWYNIYDL